MRHRWDINSTKRSAACDNPDGNGRTERSCAKCGMVKITVHGGDGKSWWHEWRTAEGALWRGEATPPCNGLPDPTVAAETTAKVIAV